MRKNNLIINGYTTSACRVSWAFFPDVQSDSGLVHYGNEPCVCSMPAIRMTRVYKNRKNINK